MNRPERVCFITQILCGSPNKDFSLGFFAEKLGCAKSSISEDVKIVRESMEKAGLGYLETTSGVKGGIRFVPYISDEKARAVLEDLRDKLLEPDRLVGGGFFYTADLMFDPVVAKGVGSIFAKHFAATDADVVVTVETKGIAIAVFTAEMLHLPLAVIRREAKITEGSTISINYFSGSSDRIQKMSLSKRAVKKGSKAILIDDFMRGGGSIDGMKEILSEFDVSTAGVGVVITAGSKSVKNHEKCFALLHLDDENGRNDISIVI